MVVVGLYLMTFFTIPYQEDNEYGVTGFLRRQGLSSDLNLPGIWNQMVHLWNYCNGRVIDKLPVPVLALMPRWLFRWSMQEFLCFSMVALAKLWLWLLAASGVESL